MANLGRICILLLAAALTICTALAQQTTGTVKGTLLDDSGASVPAANVTLTGPGSAKTVKTAQTQADGTYTFTGLVPGQYTMGVVFPGFATIAKPVTVAAGQTLTVPVQLNVAAEKQSVEVKGESTVTVSVEPDNNATALVIKGEDLASLPDDPDDLADALQALAGPGAGPNGGQIYIDGFSGGQLPPKESIREIRINQNPFSAEFDRLGFGRIEILTKPGSDHFHGAFRFNDTDSLFDSRNPFESSKPAYSVRNLSFNVGGPMSHRSSFFFDVSRRSITDNSITLATYVDPSSYALIPVTTPVVTPTVQYNISPRLDYQLSTNNTLTVRFEDRWNSRENAGLGGYKLPPGFDLGTTLIPPSSFAYNSSGDNQNLMVTETNIVTPKIVNETRFQFTRSWTASNGNLIPSVNVADEFTTGGNGIGDTHDRSKHFELQNYTSISHGTHTIRFGARVRRESDQSNNPSGYNGSFTFLGGTVPVLNSANQIVYDSNGNEVTTLFNAAQQYIRNLQLTAAGLSQTVIQTLGGGPSRFTIQSGIPYISYDRWDAGPFVQDDWRIKPNLTLSLGLRYEVQTLISEKHDVAPRLGFAWAPGNAKNGRQKTVIRGGFGIFYDRVSYSDYEQAALNNGHTQLQYQVYNPTFYPNLPALGSLSPAQNATFVVDPNLRSDYSLQGAIGVERQLPKNTRLSATYTYDHAEHLGQTVPINTPLPGTFNPLLPLSATNGVFPYGYNAGNIFEYESGGKFNQHIVMVGLNTAITRNISINANYQLTYAKDLPGSPSDPYDFNLDYGRSNLDRRHNLSLFGNIIAPLGIRIAPFVTLRSGAPYDVEIGEDIFGDTLTNVRAAYAPPGSTCGGNIKCTPFGDFNTAVTAGNLTNLVPRNLLTMPALLSVNTRVYRIFGFGPRRGANPNAGGGPDGGPGGPGGGGPGGGGFGGGGGGARGGGGGGGRGGGGGGMRMGPAGGGRGGGAALTEHRFNLNVGVNVTNVLNHYNPSGYNGTLTSTYFGEPTGANTSFGGGGIGGAGAGSNANNRRLDFSVSLNF
jgi:Carboxypeptidase regulatory-like domain